MSTTKKANQSKAKSRPTTDESRLDGATKVARQRVPLDGDVDILTVRGKDNGYEYRWVKDLNEDGSRIKRFKAAGYSFVTSEENLDIGDDSVFRTENIGSFVSKPESDGSHLYLMKQVREYYEEDQQAKSDKIRAKIQDIKDSDLKTGYYGTEAK